MEPKCTTLYRTLRPNPSSGAARGASLIDAPISEKRIDPISGRQVLIAEDRSGRPSDFSDVEPVNRAHTDCPFCAGNEHSTPQPSLVLPGEQDSWQVRVVPNKYPAVTFAETTAIPSGSQTLLQDSALPAGAHEVIIESPNHVQGITELTASELMLVLQAYRQRLLHWSTDKRIQHVTIFKNQGSAAGASLEHTHSQLIALPQVPAAMAVELQAAQNYYTNQHACIFCQLLGVELSHRERLVSENEKFVAICAYAGRQPYETWVMPKEHSANFEQLDDNELESLASLLQDLVARLRTQINPLSYNLILHTVPFLGDHSALYHWHFELVPRITRLAGFEWASGMHINPLAPERAAASLRDF